MTTPKLPTRDDGGIDWDKIMIVVDPEGCCFVRVTYPDGQLLYSLPAFSDELAANDARKISARRIACVPVSWTEREGLDCDER